MLDLCIANLKTVEKLNALAGKAQLVGHVCDQIAIEAYDERRIGAGWLPDAGCIGGNDLDIAMNGPSAMAQAAALARHVDGAAKMNGNTRVWRWRSFDTPGWIDDDSNGNVSPSCQPRKRSTMRKTHGSHYRAKSAGATDRALDVPVFRLFVLV